MDGGDRPDRRMGDDRAGYRRGDRKLLSELSLTYLPDVLDSRIFNYWYYVLVH